MKIVWQKMVPELDVSEFSVSLKFYTEIFGFKVLYARHDPEFVYLEQEELQFMLIQRREDWLGGTLEKPYGRGVNLQMELSDIQPIYKRLLENNTTCTGRSKTRGERQAIRSRVHESFGCRTRTAICCAFVNL